MTENISRGQKARTAIIQSAARLVREKGFENTSLADIAEASGVPKGNFYYYFKTKSDLGRAIIERLDEQIKEKIARAEQAGDEPKKRMIAFLRSSTTECDSIARSGCPVGGLVNELAKVDPSLLSESRKIYKRLISWFDKQLKKAGLGKKSKTEATRILCVLEGASNIGNAFGDADLIRSQMEILIREVEDM